MKADHYKKLKEKYFQGETSTEEEQLLKNESTDSIFEFFKDEKQEKMDWDFDNFLEKANAQESEAEKIIPISTSKVGQKKMANYVWMAAASVVLLVGLYFAFNQNTRLEVVDEHLVQEIQKQKNDFLAETSVAANSKSPDSVTASKDSVQAESPASTNSIDEKKLMDQILPKKGRIKKITRERYAENESVKSTNKAHQNQYQESYVTVNGQKIKDEQEAIDITKYSVQLLADKMSKSIATARVQENSID